jgi:putative phosphoesterase
MKRGLMKIALVADTHIPERLSVLPSQLIEALYQVDLILHAGDFTCLKVLHDLQAIGETIAVYGNADQPEVVNQLPRKQCLSLVDRSIGLIHGNQAPEIEGEYARPEYDYETPIVEKLFDYLAGELPGVEIIVFGHFHTPVIKKWGEQLLVNPGSIAPHHGRQSFGILELGSVEHKIEIVEC